MSAAIRSTARYRRRRFPKAALNFNFDRQMDHELRYQRAEEFVDVVKGL